MIAALKAVAFDAPDIAAEADFYAALAGWTRGGADDEWITMFTPDGWRMAFQAAPDHVAPRWPDPAYPQQGHLDFRVPDIDAAADRAVSLGATLLRRDERWHTLADPAGHPFDLCVHEDPNTTVMGVMLDCPDAEVLSTFYAEVLGKPITYAAPGMAMIGEDGAQPVLFQQIDDYRAPRWPDPAYPQQLHLDLLIERADLSSARLGCRAAGTTGGCTPTRPASRSASPGTTRSEPLRPFTLPPRVQSKPTSTHPAGRLARRAPGCPPGGAPCAGAEQADIRPVATSGLCRRG